MFTLWQQDRIRGARLGHGGIAHHPDNLTMRSLVAEDHFRRGQRTVRRCIQFAVVGSVTIAAIGLSACRGSKRTNTHPPSGMALVPAGYFFMGGNEGSGAESPRHLVWLDAFYIDKYEATNRQYGEFLRATGYEKPRFWDNPRYNSPNQPVVGVSWDDAAAYCRWAGKRLPTEAEWEKAARGGLEGRKFPWGNEEPKGRAVFGQDMDTGKPAPVGSFEPNGYGLYDLAGNVWEWCSDRYQEDYYWNSPERNPTGPDSGQDRVVRGGSWIGSGFKEFYDDVLRCAFRRMHPPGDKTDDFGFRCVGSP